MEITAGRRSLAYVADGEQECCGERVLVGEIVDMVLLPFSDEEQNAVLGPSDWTMTHHDEGDPFRPAHRVDTRLQRAQEVHSRWRGASGNAVEGVEWERAPGAAQLVEMARLPSRGDLYNQIPEEPGHAGMPLYPQGRRRSSTWGGCSPMLPQLPSPGGWLLELKILVGLGSQTWRRAGLNHRLASCSLVRARLRRPSPSAGRHARPDASRRTTVRGGSRGIPSWTSWRADARCRRRGHTPPCPAIGYRW